MSEMVEYRVKQTVDNPEEVRVQDIKAERIILLKISVLQENTRKS